jgi:hypothetical protein
VTTDLNTLLTGLYVKIDEYLGRPARIGRPPRLTDAELLTLAVAQGCWGCARRLGGCGSCHILTFTAAIWHNRATNQPLTRSLIAYDH